MSAIPTWLYRAGLIFFCFCLMKPGNGQTGLDVDSTAISSALFHQGTYHLINREWSPALQAFRNSLQFADDRVLQSAIHQNLGSLHFLLADYQKAAIHFEYTLQLLDETAANQWRLAEVCLNLGFTCLERGETAHAERWFDQATRHLPGRDSRWSVRLALGRGNLQFSKGSFLEAITEYETGLASTDPGFPASEEEIWLLKNLAWSYQSAGKPDSASRVLDRALNRLKSTNYQDYLSLPEILLQKSQVLRSSDNFLESLQLLNRALDQLPRSDSITRNPGSEPVCLHVNEFLRYRILYERGIVKWKLLKEKANKSAEIANLYNEILFAIELGELLGGDRVLHDLIALQPEIQRSLTGVALELLFLKREEPFLGSDAQLNLVERLTLFEVRCRSNMNPGLSGVPDSLRSDVTLLKRQLFILHKLRFLEGAEKLKPETKMAKERVGLLRRLDSYEYSPLSNDDFHLFCSLAEIRVNLEPDEVLLSYLVIDTTLFTLVITTDTMCMLKQVAGLDVIRDGEDCVRALKILDPPAFYEGSIRLYQTLIAPVKNHLTGRFRLHLIPNHFLSQLPFEALVAGDDRLTGHPGDYLINGYELAYHTSVSAWCRQRKQSADSVSANHYEYDFGACAPEFKGTNVTAIPNAIREVERIARSFRMKNRQTRTLIKNGVGIDSLLAVGNQSRIFHMATHGYRDAGNPEFSGWMMPGDPAPFPRINASETRLEIGALQSFQLRSDLLVLSSCPVGTDPAPTSYRMTRFPYNFFQAGVSHILYSLWEISDEHTNDFMVAFYSKYLEGRSYAASLRAAKLKMLATPETSFPTHWAVFMLLSDCP